MQNKELKFIEIIKSLKSIKLFCFNLISYCSNTCQTSFAFPIFLLCVSKEFKNVLPCIDFAHMHARSNGLYNTYDEFSKIMEFLGKELGDNVFNNFHAHLAGIEYGIKGEKKHLILEESDMSYKDLLKVFKEFDVKGVLVCESPNIEEDTKLLKDYYLSL